MRECTVCPPWIEWCAHFGDWRVMLTSGGSKCSQPTLTKAIGQGSWKVAVVKTVLPCPLGEECLHGPLSEADEIALLRFPTRADAEAEFHRREAALLGREP